MKDISDSARVTSTLLLAGDWHNSVLSEVKTGQVNRLAYSAYGQQSAQAVVSSHTGYNGELREAKIGWYLLGKGYRAFNPLLMRFHSPDSASPFGRGGLNAYAYCGGDPIGFTDPDGHVPLLTQLMLRKMPAGDRRIMLDQRPPSTSAIKASKNMVTIKQKHVDRSHAKTSLLERDVYNSAAAKEASHGNERVNAEYDRAYKRYEEAVNENIHLMENVGHGKVPESTAKGLKPWVEARHNIEQIDLFEGKARAYERTRDLDARMNAIRNKSEKKSLGINPDVYQNK